MAEVTVTFKGEQIKEEAELVVAVMLTREAGSTEVHNVCKGVCRRCE